MPLPTELTEALTEEGERGADHRNPRYREHADRDLPDTVTCSRLRRREQRPLQPRIADVDGEKTHRRPLGPDPQRPRRADGPAWRTAADRQPQESGRW